MVSVTCKANKPIPIPGDIWTFDKNALRVVYVNIGKNYMVAVYSDACPFNIRIFTFMDYCEKA